MGIYGITKEDLIDEFEEFLHSQEGDVSAEVVAKAWNSLAKKYGWKDKLQVRKRRGR